MGKKLLISVILSLMFWPPSAGTILADTAPCRKPIESSTKSRPWLKHKASETPVHIEPSKASQKALGRLMIKAGFQDSQSEPVLVNWNPFTGFPEKLEIPSLGPSPINRPTQEIASEFLAEWQDLTGIEPRWLEKPRISEQDGVTTLEYPEAYRGIRVQGSRVRIRIEGGQVRFIDARDYYPDMAVSVSPRITAEEAVNAVERFEEYPHESPSATQTPLVILPDCGMAPNNRRCEFHLAWKVVINLGEGVQIRGYYVDAHSGEIIGEYRIETC